ncbi:DUF1611 domain-containing protein [Reichenbachiella agariperforans]|uniref:DUF1611 domain-containing protein n=1 Tax=Reichenbachiella agariperforans TaxID=156994 RepID=UPI001C09AB67|nr:DUF1611 domain-containing protein [Reichenbachiella agariperforans]MBU2912568.1 DUF1611 domain-containing protein [Reichenbachiella agariperforans]
MTKIIDGNALVYCEGAFNTPNGKTAHGLVRFTERYKVLGVIDSRYAGQDAGEVLDGKKNGIPVFASFLEALDQTDGAKYFVMGLAPDGGRLPDAARADVHAAVKKRLNVDSGLHDFMYKDAELVALAKTNGVKLRDIRRTPEREELHFFSGKIEEVSCLKLAVLGTDSAVGKRTTAWIIVHGLRQAGKKAEMIGTGQTGWMQGAKYSMVMDSLINDFVSGEIEHAVHSAWKNEQPDAIVIEGQGSLMNPAYPGGFEILAAGRPDFVILQHAPRRLEYDGFPGYPIQPIREQIAAIEMISGKKVLAITLNHEDMDKVDIASECVKITAETGLLCTDVLQDGPEALVSLIMQQL